MNKAIRGKIQKAYIAGLVDGEGCIGVYRFHGKPYRERGWNPRYTAYVAINNCDKNVLVWIKKLYGGHLSTKKRYKEWHKEAWVLQIQDNNLKIFLKAIMPYLMIKNQQARNVLDFWKMMKSPRADYGRGKQRLTVEELSKREKYYQISLSLNKRGLRSPAETKRKNT